jgi:hypothetical protein
MPIAFFRAFEKIFENIFYEFANKIVCASSFQKSSSHYGVVSCLFFFFFLKKEVRIFKRE